MTDNHSMSTASLKFTIKILQINSNGLSVIINIQFFTEVASVKENLNRHPIQIIIIRILQSKSNITRFSFSIIHNTRGRSGNIQILRLRFCFINNINSQRIEIINTTIIGSILKQCGRTVEHNSIIAVNQFVTDCSQIKNE